MYMFISCFLIQWHNDICQLALKNSDVILLLFLFIVSSSFGSNISESFRLQALQFVLHLWHHLLLHLN